MRPVRLELEGFTAFRQREVVDFADADLFALVGPTGAGKSSLIDAMCFSLYGAVPRLDRRTVEPVIAAGVNQARVRLDFTIGETRYSAARVVRRLSRGGATTSEARLECGAEIVAGDADGVTRCVEELLGLGFEQFTTCIVLPQGEFARFLHDKPRDRQDLLVRLLELGIYDRMREAATGRRSAADTERMMAEQELQRLADVTDEALGAAARRVERLEALRDRLDEAQPRLDALEGERAAALEAAREADERVALLAAVEVPAGLEKLAAAAEAAQRDSAELAADVERVEAALLEREAHLAALPARADVERDARAHTDRAGVAERIARGAPILADARDAEERAQQHLAAAEDALVAARDALDATKRNHTAVALAAHLTPGEPCPVCTRIVDDMPHHDEPPALTQRQEALDAAAREHANAAAACRAASEQRAKSESTMEQLQARLRELDDALRARPDPATIERQLADIAAAEQAVADLRGAERAARERLRRAAAVAQRAAAQRDEAWTVFERARDSVAALGPPAPDRRNLPGSWNALAVWAAQRSQDERAAVVAAHETAKRAAADHAALTQRVRRACGDAGIDPSARRPRDACADALAAAREERERLAEGLARAAELRERAKDQSERAVVAQKLAEHLSARGFERWLLDEALDRLVDGAGAVLEELSGGQYCLAIDAQRNFAVVDHRNADERRSARTLSGGETFLASLALALTLADQLAELAAASRPRLESMFLDEGFGTLDPATLDTVAAALEELGSRGRTVGLVTHVRELAERLPVRFEVRRAPAGSTVERVAA